MSIKSICFFLVFDAFFQESRADNRVNTVSGKNVNTARPKEAVNAARPKAVLNAVKGNQVNVVKASACCVWKPNTKVLDHVSKYNSASITLKKFDYVDAQGRSKHMKGNMSYLTDFEEIDRGYVAFGETFPRKNNMYIVDLKNIVPKGGLTCLFAKATSNESKLWHRRLGHINFKNMNKLVKGNLVRGLPSKLFEIDQTCVACQKGKQHRASFVIDDYSRFSWVFFLATKDESSGIPKSFIIGVENLIDQRVKVTRCDNRTEFKNKEMNQFCERKGIKREFNVARTPQQNRVAERKNRTLIEATRTMLADSKLPTTFWAEAFNTACYVQNRLLVIKPHNKTPYELFLGRKPTLSFMRPFGCPFTILNTIDHLGKFNGKADKGFFVGYSINSKAFRVFNSRTRIVEENLHVQFSENTPNNAGSTKACDDACKARMETVPDKDYILLPLWPADPLLSQNSKSSPDDGFKPLGDNKKKVTEELGKEDDDQEKDDNVSSTNNVNTASDGNNTNNVNVVSSTINTAGIEVNVVGAKSSIELPYDPNMPELEDIVYSNDDEGVGAEADMNNLDAFMPVSPILTTRVHKDHLVEKIIRDLNSAPQTRRIIQNLEEHVKQKEDGIFISQDKYVIEILKKFGFTNVKTASTPMETQKPLLKDEDGEEVDVHLYRSMIGSLMYLTSSRPDIMFAMCACARYQVNPKVSHLHAVKRIFRYLKVQPKLGLWYPKYSPFDLVAYTDSDYAGASLDMKSTIGGCQFLGCRLISWQCKKQSVVDNSTTEAKYVAASSCCGQVLWIQNQLLDYGDSNEKKLIQMIKIHTDKNVADLLTKAFDVNWNGKAVKDEFRNGIGVNTGDSKLMLLGINLLLLEKVNAARHSLTTAVES
ncbi:putative ribonuclease H-like domain-containing protein [Tanacetum coccineum]